MNKWILLWCIITAKPWNSSKCHFALQIHRHFFFFVGKMSPKAIKLDEISFSSNDRHHFDTVQLARHRQNGRSIEWGSDWIISHCITFTAVARCIHVAALLELSAQRPGFACGKWKTLTAACIPMANRNVINLFLGLCSFGMVMHGLNMNAFSRLKMLVTLERGPTCIVRSIVPVILRGRISLAEWYLERPSK